MPAGRPSKLTPQIQDTICGLIAKGHTQAAACAAVNVSYSSFHKWKQRGESATSGQYRQLVDALKTADEKWVQSHLDNIANAATEPSVTKKTTIKRNPSGKVLSQEEVVTETAPVWTASAWLLERRRPEEFGRRVVQHDGHIDGNVGGGIKVELIAPKETPNVHMPDASAEPEPEPPPEA